MGYAAGRCPRFRAGEGEAVRFAIASGAGGGEATVRWLIEADHLPVASGELPASVLEGETHDHCAPPLVRIQARAYLHSWNRSARMLR